VLNPAVSLPINQQCSARIGRVTGEGLASERQVMGAFVVKHQLKWLGWTATAAMAAAVVLMLVLKIQQ
jgi:Mn2+/Fe2+ NRAMP family transporter